MADPYPFGGNVTTHGRIVEVRPEAKEGAMNRYQRRGEPTGHVKQTLWALLGFPLTALLILVLVIGLIRFLTY